MSLDPLDVRFRAGLLASTAVVAALPGGIWDKLPQNPTYPVAQYQLISDPRCFTMDQQGNPKWGGVGWARYQVTLFSNDGANGHAKVVTAAAAIRAALKTFDLSIEDGATFGTAPNFVLREWAGDIPETNPPVFTRMLDARCFFRDQ